MKYHLLTFGCQMNKNDSERIAGMLLNLGFEPTDNYREADLIILNTCSVRQASEDRIYGMMKNFNQMKKERPELMIVVTGCMAGRDKDGAIRKRLSGVDIFLPTERITELPGFLATRLSSPRKGEARRGLDSGNLPAPLLSKEGTVSDFFDIVPKQSSKSQAFVTIQTGCEEYCTYCVVPAARGKIKNRPLKDILDEVKKLADLGCVEIMLLGQIVNAWESEDVENFLENNPYKIHPSPPLKKEGASPFGKGGLRGISDFAALLWEINQITGVKRLNFMSAHPRYMTDKVIEALKFPAHFNFLHLPMQSGSDKILEKMNRRYTAEEYLGIIKKIRAAKPDIALATDIIVGFPGETEKDFEDTVELYKKCDFDIAFLAKYSPRSGTPAWKALKDDVPHDEKERRWRVLQKLMEEIVLRKNQKYLGREVEVLVESFDASTLSPKGSSLSVNPEHAPRSGAVEGVENGICAGNSREMKLTQFTGTADLVGKIINVKIKEAKEWILFGEAEK